MAEDVKRVHYFDHQFLHEKDFTDEQAYHIRLRREHNRRLHTWGIVHGLDLSFVIGAALVTVGAGMAIDEEGQEIVLAGATETIDLSNFAGGTAFVTIAYHQEETNSTTETGVTGNTRWTERPTIDVSAGPPTDAGLKLILGRVTVDAAGKVTGTDEGAEPNRRRTAGVVGGDMEVSSLTLASPSVASGNWVHLRLDTENTWGKFAKLDSGLWLLETLYGTRAWFVEDQSEYGIAIAWNAHVTGKNALIAAVTPNHQFGTMPSALAAVSDAADVFGIYAVATDPGTYALYVHGNAYFSGNKGSYVVDIFVNGSGHRLETGDIVKLKGTPVKRFHGTNNKIPVAEITLSDTENDPTVIGIVDGEAIPLPDAPDRRVERDDPTFIEDGGEVFVVTLGAYAHCKVDATETPIAVGDLLTTSANPGHAKKATNPKIGCIIGKALEPLDQGTGYIAVFANIQ